MVPLMWWLGDSLVCTMSRGFLQSTSPFTLISITSIFYKDNVLLNDNDRQRIRADTDLFSSCINTVQVTNNRFALDPSVMFMSAPFTQSAEREIKY